MSLPEPLPGLVLRYSYLWADDAARGIEEGDKDRPAVVVLSIPGPAPQGPRVLVLPITHSPPTRGVEALMIPAAVARAAGLDAAESWVVLSEFNEFVWPGFDLRMVPHSKPATVAYGFLTPGFFRTVRDRFLTLDATTKSRPVSRDE